MSLVNCYRQVACSSLLALACWSGSGLAHLGVDERISTYDALIKEQPDQSGLYLKRGELQRENKHWHLAWADYQQALRLAAKPEQQLEILFCMGRMKLQSGQPEQALPLLEKVLNQDPGYVRARLNLARAYFALGKPTQAVDHMDRYIALLRRPSPDFYLERAQMVQALGPGSYERVVRGLDEGINTLGPIVTLLGKLIEVHLQHGDTERALARFEQLPPLIKSLPRWQAKKGDIYTQAGNHQAACGTYQEARQSILDLPSRRRSTPAMRDLKKYLGAQFNSCREVR